MPVGFFWHAGHSQIYPELARLEAAGLVEQSKRPDKKLYRLIRDELTLRAHSLWLADLADLRLFREHAEAHEARSTCVQAKLDALEREQPQVFSRPDSPDFGHAAVLLHGISHSREYATWCRWVMGQLERGLGSQEG